MKKNKIKTQSSIGYIVNNFITGCKFGMTLGTTGSWFNFKTMPDDISDLGEVHFMDLNGTSVPYIYNPGACAGMNMPIAMSLALTNFKTMQVHLLIFVDDTFMKMSPIAQKFIISHEYGHIINHHLEKMSDDQIKWCEERGLNRSEIVSGTSFKQLKLLSEMSQAVRSFKYEAEADAFGASVVGVVAARNSLREMYKITPIICRNKRFKEDVKNRLDALCK